VVNLDRQIGKLNDRSRQSVGYQNTAGSRRREWLTYSALFSEDVARHKIASVAGLVDERRGRTGGCFVIVTPAAHLNRGRQTGA